MEHIVDKKTIPLKAFSLEVGRFAFTSTEDGKPSPIHIIALSGEPLSHWYWGSVVQDLSGMTHKDVISIDYCHNPDEILGYVDKFSIADGKLSLDGALTPFSEDDRASEIIFKSKSGVPYQASIQFTPTRPDEIMIESVPEGYQAQVNGKMVSGPITIFRKWTLGAVAVCPYGADSGTSSVVQSMKGDVDVDVHTQTIGENKVDKTEAATPPAVNDQRAEFKRFVQAFGERAQGYFEQGLSYEAAQDKFIQDMKIENERLKSENTELSKKKAVIPGFNGEGGAQGQEDELPFKLTSKQIENITKQCGGKYEDVLSGLKAKWDKLPARKKKEFENEENV